MTYVVNHNGTEDWTPQPAGSSRVEGGTIVFPDLDAAVAFGVELAREVIAWDMKNADLTRAQASDVLRPTPDGVPVQIVDHRTGAVVGTINPDTFELDRPPVIVVVEAPDLSSCCGAAVSVDETGTLYCKRCFGAVYP